jgi:mannose-6-phosphate isomerase-like protein (cupin superfamily)
MPVGRRGNAARRSEGSDMKIVHADEIAGRSESQHRGGSSSRQRLLEGEVGSVDNFSLVIARPQDRYSPRHRHNFEQFRYQIEGIADYGRTGKLKPGMIGYFPEGVHYGPQAQGSGQELCLLALQFGGATGSGYPGRDAEYNGTRELMKFGTFKDGVFHRNPGVPGKKNVDGFQAIWEHLNGRPLVYAPPRYDVPILMHPDAFDWVPVEGARGVYHKLMGVFTERRAEAGFLKLGVGASHRVNGGRDIYFVLSGTGAVGGETYRRFTTVYLQTKSEHATFKASEATEMLHYRLPDLSALKAQKQPGQALHAAE